MTDFIKEINIILENTEIFTVPANKILMFEISEIKEEYLRTAINAIHKIKGANKVALLIDENANCDSWPSNMKMFERIEKHRDITAIDLVYEDNNIETIYVDWDLEDEYKNNYQETIIDKDLYITIGKDIHIKEHFEEVIKDKELLDFYKKMILEDDNEDEEKNKNSD